MNLTDLMSQVFNLQLPLWAVIIFWYIGYIVGIQVEQNYRR